MLKNIAVVFLLLALAGCSRERFHPPRSHERSANPSERQSHEVDEALNVQKNRATAPVSVRDVSVGDIISWPANGLEHLDGLRSEWPHSVVQYVQEQEKQGLRVEGYLVQAREEGPEVGNGYSQTRRDFHLWLGPSPNAWHNQCVIAEMTPPEKDRHPSWQIETLERLAERRAKVRVTGWLMWDEEHPEEVGKSRATQWEVHPITNFEAMDE